MHPPDSPVGRERTNNRLMRGAAATFLILLYAFFAAELSPGVRSNGTDWAMYVMHARNIVNRLPYTKTGYLFQPESTTEAGANSYPSGYPLLLAPVYAAFGLNIKLFKLLNAAFLVLSLWPIWLYARRTLSSIYSLLLIVVLGFSTLFLANFDTIGSDAPYQAASFFVLSFLLWIYDRGLEETEPWKWGLIAGLSIAGAYAIRPFGVAFFLAVAGTELLRKRRLSVFPIAIATALLPLILLNGLFLHKDTSYAYQFTLSIPAIARHAVAYAQFFSYAFANPVSNGYRYLLWAVTLPLALFAVARRVRTGLFGVTELYALTLFAIVSVYWSANPRYLLPIMPIYMVYIFEGFEQLVRRIPRGFTLPLKVTAAVLLVCGPAANAVLVRPDATDTLVTAPKYEELCSAVRRETAPNALIVFWNPRVLVLSTGRFSSGWPAADGPDRMMNYVRHIHPDYIVADKSQQDDQRFLLPFLARTHLQMTTVFENDQFVLVRVPENL